MLDSDTTDENTPATTEPGDAVQAGSADTAARARKTAARKTAKKAPAKRAAKKAVAAPADPPADPPGEPVEPSEASTGDEPVKVVAKKTTRKRATRAAGATPVVEESVPQAVAESAEPADDSASKPAAPAVLFKAPDPTEAKPPRKRATRKAAPAKAKAKAALEALVDDEVDDEGLPVASDDSAAEATDESESSRDDNRDDEDGEGGGRRRPRRRGGRRRRKGAGDGDSDEGSQDSGDDESSASRDDNGDDSAEQDGDSDPDGDSDGDGDGSGSTGTASRRRRRRRRGAGEDSSEGSEGGSGNGGGGRGRRTRNAEDEITAISGSTRLEAKRQRRREGREAGRRRAPIVSEAEFLARREAVDRVMVIRQRDDLTQIAVLEDKVLVEHYVARVSQTSLIGNVYLGRVQNVLPSMEAAFIDIGKGRNAVLYAGEVNWTALGAKDGQPRKIESVLTSGQPILVQVSKDPIGHKGARLTSQVSLPGRFLVYVPDGTTSGISRKLPENERTRLKTLLKEIVPDTAGVIVRTAAEGASEEELTQDVERLTARWADIEEKIRGGQSPQLLYGEPDLTLKVVRDLFTEDFTQLIVQGDDAWDLVDNYVAHVAPDLRERLERYRPEDHDGIDLFGAHRLDEQIAKGVDRKVWLPSGGSLVIDRTEAMTVVDVNTGKFTGSGGNLEETVTKNNLEAAEEIVRQLRLRDIGGIIVVDFIDMVLESNRDLVLRRMVECLGRDRTRHQVAEVTSLGLVQMTRKRIGTGLLEAFSEECDACKGRGLMLHDQPIEPSSKPDEADRRGGRRGRGRGRGDNGGDHHPPGNPPGTPTPASHAPSPKDVAAMARPENADRPPLDEVDDEVPYQFPDDLPDDVAPAVDEVSAPAEISQDTEVGAAHAIDVEVVTAEATVVETTLEVTPAVPTEEAPAEQVPEVPEAEVQPVTPAEPAAPKLVTTTRRRSARRAAGPPPVVEAPAQEVPTDEAANDREGGSAEGDPETDEAGFVLHVPVKKKGVRKR